MSDLIFLKNPLDEIMISYSNIDLFKVECRNITLNDYSRNDNWFKFDPKLLIQIL